MSLIQNKISHLNKHVRTVAFQKYHYFLFMVTVYTNETEFAFHIDFDEELLGKMLKQNFCVLEFCHLNRNKYWYVSYCSFFHLIYVCF